jgi:hypothetical protein
MAKNNVKPGYDLLEKIEKCAWNKGIIINTKEAVDLIKRASGCRRIRGADACYNCPDIADCSIISKLEEAAQGLCLMCRIRENCVKIEKFTVWLKCLL